MSLGLGSKPFPGFRSLLYSRSERPCADRAPLDDPDDNQQENLKTPTLAQSELLHPTIAPETPQTAANDLSPPPEPGRFTVGWVCALSHELAASLMVWDEKYAHTLERAQNDGNMYSLGRIGMHNIAMACLPLGKYGTSSAAVAGTNMMRTFPSLEFVLMVGIAGGIPSDQHDIRLGDIVVSTPVGTHGAVVQHDMGRINADGSFLRKGTLRNPPGILLSALQNIRADHEDKQPCLNQFIETVQQVQGRHRYSRPSASLDKYLDAGEEKTRPVRKDQNGNVDLLPKIHYGLVSSGNQLVANREERERLRVTTNGDALAIEMEAAGLMDNTPCLVIRGICDYADASKNDSWQRYAALVAAAFAKELLLSIPPMATKQAAGRESESMFRGTTHCAPNISSAPTYSKADVRKESFRIPYVLPLKPVNLFIGRKKDLSRIRADLDPVKTGRKVTVLHGMGGIGKSQTSLQYCRDYQNDYSAIAWMNGSSRSDIKRSFLALARRVREAGRGDANLNVNNEESAVAATLTWLANPRNTRWLLVFDNVDLDFRSRDTDTDAFDVEDYFPSADQGSILVSTRLKSLRDIGSNIELSLLNFEESMLLLEHRTKMDLKENEHARGTIERLDGLPLALALAGSYILATPEMTFEVYNRHYDQQWARLMDSQELRPLREYQDRVNINDQSKPQSRHDRRMMTTWLVSYAEVQKQNENAALLFDLWSFFDRLTPIARPPASFSLFEYPEIGEIAWPSWFSKTLHDDLAYSSATSLLYQYSLVNVQSSNEHVVHTIHPVIHEWSFQRLLRSSEMQTDLVKCRSLCILAMDYLACSYDGNDQEYSVESDWTRTWSLSPHTEVFFKRFRDCVRREDVQDLKIPSKLALAMLSAAIMRTGRMESIAQYALSHSLLDTFTARGMEVSELLQSTISPSLYNTTLSEDEKEELYKGIREIFEKRSATLNILPLRMKLHVMQVVGEAYKSGKQYAQAEYMYQLALRSIQYSSLSIQHSSLSDMLEQEVKYVWTLIGVLLKRRSYKKLRILAFGVANRDSMIPPGDFGLFVEILAELAVAFLAPDDRDSSFAAALLIAAHATHFALETITWSHASAKYAAYVFLFIRSRKHHSPSHLDESVTEAEIRALIEPFYSLDGGYFMAYLPRPSDEELRPALSLDLVEGVDPKWARHARRLVRVLLPGDEDEAAEDTAAEDTAAEDTTAEDTTAENTVAANKTAAGTAANDTATENTAPEDVQRYRQRKGKERVYSPAPE